MASPSSSDAFGLLGLAPQYDLDPAVIEQAYFERSKELHPDRFATAPAAERVAALSRARALNDAYQTLRRDGSRAEHLLARAGVTIGDNERIDPALVMELLEEREELAEARHGGRLDRVGELQQTMQRRRRVALDSVRALFATGDLLAVKQQLILLRYIDRYLEECDHALDAD